MHPGRNLTCGLAALTVALALSCPAAAQLQTIPAHGRRGGELTMALASAPQTFNPVMATDSASNLIASLTQADLMHINPHTLQVEPALAVRVAHETPLRWIVHLRQGVRFSDGVPFTAADVAFSFAIYTDPKLQAPELDLLSADGKPIRCRVLDASTVELDLPAPFAVGDRIFDSVWMLPKHKLEALYQTGKLANAWGVDTASAAMAGLGAFSIARYAPGRELVLARNPNFWRSDARGARLPYLDALHLQVLSDPNLRMTLFARGQLDGLDAVDAADYGRLSSSPCCRMQDAGAGLNSEVLVFNQAPGSGTAEIARGWFRQTAFRQSVSEAIDRANLARSVYAGHAQPLASLTSPSMGAWADPVPPTKQDLAGARSRLQQAGFHWRGQQLVDASGHAVTFSLIVPATNAARNAIAVYLQQDLRQIGMDVQVVPLDFNSYLDRLERRKDFEAALLGVQITDADPNIESILWPLNGQEHFWNLNPAKPANWEISLDHWFRLQLTAGPTQRHADYRQIQSIEHRELPMIPLVAPDILVGVSRNLQGVEPGLLPPHLLWNADRLYWPNAH